MELRKYFIPSRVFGCTCKIWSTWKLFPLTVKYSPFTHKFIYRSHLPSKPILQTLKPEERERAKRESHKLRPPNPEFGQITPPHSPPCITHESHQTQAEAWRYWLPAKPRSSSSTHKPLSCMQAPRLRLDPLLTISSPKPMTDLVATASRLTQHDWSPLSLFFHQLLTLSSSLSQFDQGWQCLMSDFVLSWFF